jgi:hypothetical protein
VESRDPAWRGSRPGLPDARDARLDGFHHRGMDREHDAARPQRRAPLMPTVIDSLIVQLSLDPKDFVKGQKDAVTAFGKARTESVSTAKEMEARGAQAAQFFGSIKKEALGLFAVIVGAGGLEQFAVKTTVSMAALGRQAQLMGVAAGDLQAFKMMIDRTGASGDQAAASLTGLAEAMETYRTRGTISAGLLTGLNQIGGTQDDDALAIYRKFATWAKGKDARFVNQEGQMLGLDAGSIANATKGGANFDSEMARSKALGVPTDRDIAKVNELMGAFQRLRQAVTGDANALLYGAAPALSGALNLTDRLVGANKTLTQGIIAVGAAMAAWFSLKPAVWLLRLLGVAGPSAAMKGAEGRALRVAGRGLGLAARVAGPLGIAYDLLHPDALNVGEDAHMAGINARFHARAGGAPESGGLPAGVSRSVGDRIAGFLVSHGVDETHAAGILAGITAEGGLNPKAFNPAGGGQGAFGIGQWRADRLTRLRAKYGNAPSVEQQMQFLLWELKGGDPGGRSVWKAATSEGAMTAYLAHVMRPGAGLAGDLRRGHNALAGSTRRVINIDRIEVHTRATDARGIARGIGPALRKSLAGQANSGLTG